MILDEGGVRVEVEDTSVEQGVSVSSHEWPEVEERIDGGHEVWNLPSQEGPELDVASSLRGQLTPSSKARIMPTARPPM